MVKVINYTRPEDFIEANKEFILKAPMAHFHLIKIIDKLWNGEIGYFDGYNIVDTDGSNVLCLWIDNNYLIYSDKWNNDVISELTKSIKWDKLEKYDFAGQSDLVKEIFAKAQIPYEVIKERIVYECSIVSPNYQSFDGNFEKGSLKDLDILANMARNFQIEEYNGLRDDGIGNIKNSLALSLESKENKLFLWRVNEKVTSICQVLNPDEDIPYLGLLYTNIVDRSKGYATSLLSNTTNKLLQEGYEKCGLNTDITNPITNNMVKKIGYQEIYKFINIRRP